MSAVVLAYHRVARLDSDPQLLAVRPERFADHLAALRESFDVVPLHQIAAGLNSGRSPSGVAITFDDGYADNLEVALPLLEAAATPATVFVTSGYVGSRREFWWGELEAALLGPGVLPEVLELIIGGSRYAWRLGEVAAFGPDEHRLHRGWTLLSPPPTLRHRLFVELLGRLRSLGDAERTYILDQLGDLQRSSQGPREPHLSLGHDQLLQLADSDLVEIGAHTATHPMLAARPVDEQLAEMQSAKNALESMLGATVRGFSYPFGRRYHPRAYSGRSVSLVRETGFTTACSLSRRPVTRRTNVHEIPRMVARDWDAEELVRRIDRRMRGVDLLRAVPAGVRAFAKQVPRLAGGST